MYPKIIGIEAAAAGECVIPMPLNLDLCPGQGCDRGDGFRQFHELVPRVGAGPNDHLVIVVDTVAEELAAQERPDLFDGVQFRNIRRQQQKRDVVGDLEFQ